jgi:hypothetical protein
MSHLSPFDPVGGTSEEQEGVRFDRDIEDEGLILLCVLKEERSGCLRPDDQVRFFLCHFQGESFIGLKRFLLKGLIPFDRLVDIPLSESDLQSRVFGGLPIRCPHFYVAIEKDSHDDGDGDENLAIGELLGRPVMEGEIECDIDPENDERKAVDPCDISDLDKGKIKVLGVAQVCPGKTGHQERPEIFQCDPEKRGQNDHPRSKTPLDEVKEEGKCSDEEAQVEDQEE